MVDITVIVQAVLLVISLICSRYIIPWLQRKLGDAKLKSYLDMVARLALAAEGMFKGSGLGAQKKQWVIDQLKARGCTVDEAMIDSVVKEYFNMDKLLMQELKEYTPSTGDTNGQQ